MKHLVRDLTGQRIKAARKKEHLSQAALAKKIGVFRTTITMIETGKQGLRVDRLYEIADALDVDPLSLLPETSICTRRG